jgi:hypothetical protein
MPRADPRASKNTLRFACAAPGKTAAAGTSGRESAMLMSRAAPLAPRK